MRELTSSELTMVSGATGQCTPENSYGGISNTNKVGDEMVNIYEGVVQFASHVIERVANALD